MRIEQGDFGDLGRLDDLDRIVTNDHAGIGRPDNGTCRCR
jgi:hypothetical protein